MPPRRTTRASSKEPNTSPLLAGLPATTKRRTRASSKQPETPAQPTPALGSQRRKTTRAARKASEEPDSQATATQEEVQSTQEQTVESQTTSFSRDGDHENGVQAHISVKRQVKRKVEQVIENGSPENLRSGDKSGRDHVSSIRHQRVSVQETIVPAVEDTEMRVDNTQETRRKSSSRKNAQINGPAVVVEQAKAANEDAPYEPNPLFERRQDDRTDPVRQRKRRAWMAKGLASNGTGAAEYSSRENSAAASSSMYGDSENENQVIEHKHVDTESMDEDTPEADDTVADLEREMRITVERRETEQKAALPAITEMKEEESTIAEESRMEEETPSTPIRPAPAMTAATAPQPGRHIAAETPHATQAVQTPRTSILKSAWNLFTSPFASSQNRRRAPAQRPIPSNLANVTEAPSSPQTSTTPTSPTPQQQTQAAADPSHDMARASARRHALREAEEADVPRRRKMPGGWDGEEAGVGNAQVGKSLRNKLPPWVVDHRNPAENLPDIPIKPYDPAYQYKETFPGSGIPDINVISWRANLAKFMPLNMRHKPDQRLKYFLYSFGNDEQKKLINMAPLMRWYCKDPEAWKRWIPGFQSFDDFTASKRLELLKVHWGDKMKDRTNAVFDDKFVKNFRTFNVAPINVGPGLENAMDTAPASATTVSVPTVTPRTRTGVFAVPDYDDDDDSVVSIGDQAKEQRKTGHVPGTSVFTVPEGDDSSSDEDEDSNMPDTPTEQSWSSKPPPRPTPAHATLPTTPATPAAPGTISAPATSAAATPKVANLFTPAAESALDRARAIAQKHKPLNSSRLARVSPERALSDDANSEIHNTTQSGLAKLTEAVASANASAPDLSFGSLSPDEEDEVMSEVMKIPVNELPMDLFGPPPKLGPQPHIDDETRAFVDNYWDECESKDKISEMSAAQFAAYLEGSFVQPWAMPDD